VQAFSGRAFVVRVVAQRKKVPAGPCRVWLTVGAVSLASVSAADRQIAGLDDGLSDRS
jgi:hypothetical protein